MTRSAKGTVERPGTRVRQKAGLNRAVLDQGWGLLRRRTGEKAPGRVEDVPAPYTSLWCSACGWIEKDSRKSQAEFVCASCGFTCNADENAAVNVAAGQGGIPRPGAQPVPEGRQRPPAARAPVNPDPSGLESPSLQEGRMSNQTVTVVGNVTGHNTAAPCTSAPAPGVGTLHP